LTYCGDGIVQTPNDYGQYEQCDGNSTVGDHQSCDSSCHIHNLTYCGDGIIQTPNSYGQNESCDGSAGVGPHQTCDNTCHLHNLTYCGDGIVQTPNSYGQNESCDGSAGVPPGYTCDVECTLHKVPVCTNLTYTDPYYSNNVSQWIDTRSRVVISVNETPVCKDFNNGTIYYNNHLLTGENEYYCQSQAACGTWTPSAYNASGWENYSTPFPGGPESCHVIEHYAQAANGEKSAVRWDCIYEDHTPPATIKTVGEPKVDWNGSNIYYPEAEKVCWSDNESNTTSCYRVTLDTSINMSCQDVSTRPSGAKNLFFQVGLDGSDYTVQYCAKYNGTMQPDGYCMMNGSNLSDFHFTEESWHKLSFYCKDNVNKTSTPDTEYFKVEGHGFVIHLNKKWNLISFPVRLTDSNPADIFGDNSIRRVWTYDSLLNKWYVYNKDGPSDMPALKPGLGYWVLTNDTPDLFIGGSLISPAQLPPSVPIVAGWNLIGYYGFDNQTSFNGYLGNGKSAECELYSLGMSVFDKEFTSLWGYWEPFNPNQWLTFGMPDNMDPGAGYWMYSPSAGIYAPSTVCSTGVIPPQS